MWENLLMGVKKPAGWEVKSTVLNFTVTTRKIQMVRTATRTSTTESYRILAIPTNMVTNMVTNNMVTTNSSITTKSYTLTAACALAARALQRRIAPPS
jgi:hypothetical protein